MNSSAFIDSQKSNSNDSMPLNPTRIIQQQHQQLHHQETIEALLNNQMSSSSAPPQPKSFQFSSTTTGMNNIGGGPSTGVLDPYAVIDFDNLDMSLEQAFPMHERNAMRKDFEALEKMTLLNCFTTMYTLYLSQDNLKSDPKFLMSTLSGLYKTNYAVLFNKYPSLHVYVDFCLAIIIFRSPKDLKTICSSYNNNNVVTNPNTKLMVSRLIRTRKRCAPSTQAPVPAKQPIIHEPSSGNSSSSSSSDNDNMSFESKCMKHPLMNTEIVRNLRIAFNIGECLQFCIPTEFIPMFVKAQTGMANRQVKNERIPKKALILNVSRPSVTSICNRATKDKKEYYYLQSMDSLGAVITKMSKLQQMPYSFDYGRIQDLVISMVMDQNNDTSCMFDTKNMIFTMGMYNITLIDRITVFQLANDAFTTKSYSNTVYMLNSNETTKYNPDTIEREISKKQAMRDRTMEEYEAEYNITDEDLDRKSQWALNDDDVMPPPQPTQSTNIEANKVDDDIDNSPKRQRLDSDEWVPCRIISIDSFFCMYEFYWK